MADEPAPTGAPGATGELTLPPFPTGGATTSTAIGIPAGFEPPVRQVPGAPTPSGQHLIPGPVTPYGTTPHGSTYNEGDQWKPQNLPPADVWALQQQLIEAGVLTRSNVRPGVWDATSANAYKTVLGFANATGMTSSDALRTLVSNPQLQASRDRAPVQMTNPVDIAAAVSGGGPGQSNTARELLGQDLPSGEKDSFVKWYQDQENNARQQYMKADLGNQATYTGAPNLANAAQEYIKEHNLSQSVAYGTASRMLQFFDLLRTPGGHP